MIKIKIKKNRGGAMVAILDKEQNILLLKRPNVKTAWAPNKWAFPGGKIERDETPRDAAIRETKEEANLDITNLQHVAEWSNNEVSFFYTKDYSGEIKIDFEHQDWMWVGRSKIEEYELAPNVLNLYDWALSR